MQAAHLVIVVSVGAVRKLGRSPRNVRVDSHLDQARKDYREVPEDARSGVCIQCRKCQNSCPQSTLIREWMPLAHEVLGEEKLYICELPQETITLQGRTYSFPKTGGPARQARPLGPNP